MSIANKNLKINFSFFTLFIPTDKVAIKVLKRDKLDSKTQKMLLREISAMDQLVCLSFNRFFVIEHSLIIDFINPFLASSTCC